MTKATHTYTEKRYKTIMIKYNYFHETFYEKSKNIFQCYIPIKDLIC